MLTIEAWFHTCFLTFLIDFSIFLNDLPLLYQFKMHIKLKVNLKEGNDKGS